jgi:hypothetical protein
MSLFEPSQAKAERQDKRARSLAIQKNNNSAHHADSSNHVCMLSTDEAGNEGTKSFTVTVNPPTPPPIPKHIIDELTSTIQNLDDDNVPQSVKTSLTAPLKEASDILNDDNPNNDNAVCGKLGAFINQVNAAERRGALTAQQADELRTQAEVTIMNQLDC